MAAGLEVLLVQCLWSKIQVSLQAKSRFEQWGQAELEVASWHSKQHTSTTALAVPSASVAPFQVALGMPAFTASCLIAGLEVVCGLAVSWSP